MFICHLTGEIKRGCRLHRHGFLPGSCGPELSVTANDFKPRRDLLFDPLSGLRNRRKSLPKARTTRQSSRSPQIR